MAVKITMFSLYFSLFLTGEKFARDCLLRQKLIFLSKNEPFRAAQKCGLRIGLLLNRGS